MSERKLLQWVPKNETAQGPTQAHDDDAGFDLYVDGDWTVQPGQFVDISLGISVKLPGGTWGLLTGRSSTLRRLGLMVTQGVIDCGYTGPLFAGVWNLTQFPVEVKHGDRIAQFIIMPNVTESVVPQKVISLPGTTRGSKGFGSSGR